MGTHLERDLPASALPDFWRSGATNVAGSPPDGITDTTDQIHREGRVGIQNALGAIPTIATHPLFEIANGGRTGVDGRNAGTAAYVTANASGLVGGGGAPGAMVTPTVPIVDFRHSNQTQGFAFAFNGIYASGSNVDQDFILQNRGSGQYTRNWQALLGGFAYDNEAVDVTPGQAQGWQHRWIIPGVVVGVDLFRLNNTAQGGLLGYERFFQIRRPDGALANHSRQTWSFASPNTPAFNVNPANQLGDQLLTMWGDPLLTGIVGTYSFGMRGSELAAFVPAGSAFATRRGSDGQRVFGINTVATAGAGGDAVIDPDGLAIAGFANGLFRFGGYGSGEGIKSQRVVGGIFQNSIEFYTAAARRGAFLNNGRLYLAVVPTFATDALAGAGGLTTGEVYKDVFGALRIKL